MSEEPSITVRARYRRVVQVKPYETSEAELFIEEMFPGQMTSKEIVEIAQSQFQAIKSTVYQELGLHFQSDEDTGIILEAFPDSELVTSTSRHPSNVRELPKAKTTAEELDNPDLYEEDEPEPEPAPRPRRNTATTSSQRPPARRASQGVLRPRGGGSRSNSGDDLWQELLDNPDHFYDNRDEKTNDKAPDFRHKTKKDSNGYKVGLWLNSAPDWFADASADE